MALLYIDGFEDNDSTDSGSFIVDLWRHQTNNGVYWSSIDVTGSIAVPSSAVARTTQPSLTSRSLPISGGAFNLSVPAVSTIFIGFGWRQSWSGSNTICGVALNSAQTWGANPSTGIRLGYTAAGQLEVRNNNTNAVLATSTVILGPATWHYIEMKYVFGTTTGAVQVRVDGEDVINLTNINSTGTAASINTVYLQGASNFVTAYYDDFYVCDNSGTNNNNFLGPINVYSLPPTGDSSVQMTRSAGTTNYTLIDEASPNGTTDYVTAAAANLTDLYSVANLPANLTSETIHGVLIKAKSWKTGTSGELQLGAKVGGTTLWSSNKAVKQVSHVNNFTILDKQPDGTTNWDKTAVDSLEVGIKSV